MKAPLAKVQPEIGSFVVREIAAYPSVSECDLQKQLARAFAMQGNGCGRSEESNDLTPRLCQFLGPQERPPRHRRHILRVARLLRGGFETVLESYLWERDHGVRRGASLLPVSFTGVMSKMEKVSWFVKPDSYWVLVSGMMRGASGQVLGGTAAVFEVGFDDGRLIWNAPPDIGNVSAHAHPIDERWEIEYVDSKEFYASLPESTLLDIYKVDYGAHAYHRIVHQALD